MMSSIFWEVNRRFWELGASFKLVSCLPYCSALKTEAIYSSEVPTFIGVHGVISHKTEMFTVKAVRTLNPT
jgi:hypothetical protein